MSMAHNMWPESEGQISATLDVPNTNNFWESGFSWLARLLARCSQSRHMAASGPIGLVATLYGLSFC